MTTQDSQSELREQIRDIVFTDGCSNPDYITDEKLMPLIEAYVTTRVKETEDNLIDKAHKPCECGREHFGTPVRSVQGNITTYCQFSRLVPQEALTTTTNGKDIK